MMVKKELLLSVFSQNFFVLMTEREAKENQ